MYYCMCMSVCYTCSLCHLIFVILWGERRAFRTYLHVFRLTQTTEFRDSSWHCLEDYMWCKGLLRSVICKTSYLNSCTLSFLYSLKYFKITIYSFFLTMNYLKIFVKISIYHLFLIQLPDFFFYYICQLGLFCWWYQFFYIFADPSNTYYWVVIGVYWMF